ncbi:hypothetical protein SERLA73DRAFT_176729, partial [Serpula lacrymans var. lacrymans S7.3]
MVSDPGIRFAISLLFFARQHRQRCSEQAYQSIINACLVQGEIIVASLLFVILVKDWEVRRNMAARLRGQIQEEEDAQNVELSQEKRKDLRSRLTSTLSEVGISPNQFVAPMLQHIEVDMLRDPYEESSQPLRRASLQALANFAG